MTFAEFQNQFQICLNQQQLEAVQSVDGPTLLLAVPGSGKTTVLVTRLGYMIYCCGIIPESILTLTYTIAATKDMADRFIQIFDDHLSARLEFRTINGICAKVINYYGALIGKNAFELVTDEKNISGLLSSIYQKVENSFATESDLKSIRTLITYIKNMMLSEEEIRELEKVVDFKISEIYKIYCTEMRSRGLMDYDDQMTYAYRILKSSRETLAYFQQRYTYICVDEAQDTSKIQHAIIALLAANSKNLFMVGDEDQSIYGFRAAYPEALLSFEQDYPDAKVFLMEENFRSNAKIVLAAAQFIQKNTLRYEKHMRAFRESGSDIEEIKLKNRKAQYNYLMKVAEGCKKQTAVLYRDNESALPLIDLLERNKISYKMRSAEFSFFTHRTVLDIQNIFRFALNSYDTESFMQIYYKINTYINKKNAVKFCEISEKLNISVLDAAVRFGHFPGYTVGSIKGLQTHLNKLLSEPADKAIYRIIHFMGYGDYLERAGIGDGKLYILQVLGARESSPESFMNRMTELQLIIRNKQSDPSCNFILSTIHASKGLEYDKVYLLDVADGVFPENVLKNPKKADSKEREAYEEERRLFYVAATRAKNDLCIFKTSQLSTFCDELLNRSNQQKKKITSQNPVSKKIMPKQKSKTKTFSQAEYEAFRSSLGEGIIVEHKKLGQGCVVQMNEERITIEFNGDRKIFQLRFLFENQMLK